MKISLKRKIFDYVKAQYPNFVHKGEIGKKAVLEWGFENENMGRRCRELEKEGYFEVDYVNGCAVYRYKPKIKPVLTEEEIAKANYYRSQGILI
jgi:hypothetical protein